MTGFSLSVPLWCVSILLIFECNMPPTCVDNTEIVVSPINIYASIVEDEVSQSSPI